MAFQRSGRASLRWTVFLLVLIPLLATVVIYSYALAGQFGNAVQLANAGKVSGATLKPVTAALSALAAERDAAVQSVLNPGSGAMAGQLKVREAATDRAIAVVRGVSRSGPVLANASTAEKHAAEQFVGDLVALQTTRATVASHGEAIEIIKQYAEYMNDGLSLATQAVEQTYTNESLGETQRADIMLEQAALTSSEEGAFYTANAADKDMTQGDQESFAQLASQRQYLVSAALPQLDAQAASLVSRYVPDDLTNSVDTGEDTITTAPPASAWEAMSAASWQQTADKYAAGLQQAASQSTASIQSQLVSSARRALAVLIAAASLGLLAVIVSIIFSLIAGRRLVRRLGTLRAAALDLAQHRLPSVMARLRAGETVDVDAETAADVPRADEIGQVQQAFNVVLRAAVQAGADEAGLRRGLNDVFRNLARRNQTLLHRQLALLDSMERRAEEPALLEDLFRIDHMTTRMRRHAEGLIILAGESPGRRWSQPVPFIDVLRAATAEVEDYTRIHHAVRTESALAGSAVADVVHLLAELIENAAVFSPPNTRVQVRGEPVGRGFAIEIEDRGLGIPADRMAEINRDLAENPAFDLGESDRLGLFIAGRLASRHGIAITLKSSPYGGTSAVVVIPLALIVPDESPAEPAMLEGLAEPAGVGARAGSALYGAADGDWMPPAVAAGPAGGYGRPERREMPALNGYLPGDGDFGPADSRPAAGGQPGGNGRAAGGNGHGGGTSGNGHGTNGNGHGAGTNGHGHAGDVLSGRPAAGPLDDPLAPPLPAGPSRRPGPAADYDWWSKPDPEQEQAQEQAQAAGADLPVRGSGPEELPARGQVLPEELPVRARPAEELPVRGRPAGDDLPGSGQQSADEPTLADGLPVRVPQASLAPQLRDPRPAAGGAGPRPAAARPASAEAARSSMASLQRGLERGRSETGEFTIPAADRESRED